MFIVNMNFVGYVLKNILEHILMEAIVNILKFIMYFYIFLIWIKNKKVGYLIIKILLMIKFLIHILKYGNYAGVYFGDLFCF